MVDDVQTIGQRLKGNLSLALHEGDLYFSWQGNVWTTLRRIAGWLEARQMPYVALDDLAMFHHGFRQYTKKVAVLVTLPGFAMVEGGLTGFARTLDPKTFIDCETGVPIVFRLEGDQPRDGIAGNVRFPSPSSVADVEDGLCFMALPDLVSLKLTGWLSEARVTRDVVDVQEMIKTLCLTKDFAAALYPDVRDCYLKICGDIDASCGQFLLLWEHGERNSSVLSLDELITAAGARASELRAMQRDGVTLWSVRPFYQGCPVLCTSDRTVASKYEMHHESEYWFRDDL